MFEDTDKLRFNSKHMKLSFLLINAIMTPINLPALDGFLAISYLLQCVPLELRLGGGVARTEMT